jgi:foldase protein PrsA
LAKETNQSEDLNSDQPEDQTGAAEEAKTDKPAASEKAAKSSGKANKANDKTAGNDASPIKTDVVPVGAASAVAKPAWAMSRKSIIAIAASVLVGLLLFLTIFGVLIYKYRSDSDLVYGVAKVVPYPVERVNGDFVSYGQYLFEFRSIKHFYGKRQGAEGKPLVDFSTPEGQGRLVELRKQILEQLKTDAVAKQLIAEHKINVTDKEVEEQIDQLAKQAGAEEKAGADKYEGIKKVLAEYYGWTLEDLKPKVRFQLGKQKLQEKLANDESVQAQAKTKAEEVAAKVKAGEDFAELAKKHSQDSSAASGGDLGFFSKGQMVPEFEAAAFALQPGQVSDIIKSKFGYHIIKVAEKKDDQVRASHILIKSVDFEQYLKDRVASAKVSTYLKV